jgi:enoyl-CoA hydratase/carnithine racemase
MHNSALRQVNYCRTALDGTIIGRLTINNPRRANALSDQVVDEVASCLSRAQDDALGALLIEARGRNFSGGVDLSAGDGPAGRQLAQRFIGVESLLRQLTEVNTVTFALVHGAVLGAAADLVAACDYRIAVDDCKFRFPGWQFGLALGTRRLVNLIGRTRALEILLTARWIDTEEAERIGLLTHRAADVPTAMHEVSRLAAAAARIEPSARSQLLRLTRDGANTADMGELARSLAQGDISERVSAYREHTRKEPVPASAGPSAASTSDTRGQ